ncbi:MAG: hypothetical protein M3R08_03280 [Bacteroidota bacterium]|nr:hypothetical protein [Bacteroidota bacterium]
MTKFEKRILLGLAILVIVLSIMEAMVPQPTDWNPSYSQYHRKPYGGELVHEALSDVFPEVRTATDPPYTLAYDRVEQDADPVNFIYINSAFELDQLNADQLLRSIAKGDHVLVAATYFNGPFADTLNVEMSDRMITSDTDTSDIRFIGPDRIMPGVFRYSRGFPNMSFISYDTSRTRVLAVNGSSEPVLLHMNWGEGSIILCSAPLAFTNYNLIKGKNASFMAGVFSILPYRTVYWDEFFKVGRQEASTPLRYILSQPALRWAWFFALALIVLYMLTYARRQQRPIPIVRPLSNATRDLTRTIGRLYWQKGDHAGIAKRMIAHFKEELRERTYLRTFNYDRETIHHLATKTGLPESEVDERLSKIEKCEKAPSLTEIELLKLSKELHEFRQLL